MSVQQMTWTIKDTFFEQRKIGNLSLEEIPRVNKGCMIPLGTRLSYMSCVICSYKPCDVGPVLNFIFSTILLLIYH